MVPKFQSFFKISCFVSSRRKKLIQVCNNLRVSSLNYDRIVIFWVEYPFKGFMNWLFKFYYFVV